MVFRSLNCRIDVHGIRYSEIMIRTSRRGTCGSPVIRSVRRTQCDVIPVISLSPLSRTPSSLVYACRVVYDRGPFCHSVLSLNVENVPQLMSRHD